MSVFIEHQCERGTISGAGCRIIENAKETKRYYNAIIIRKFLLSYYVICAMDLCALIISISEPLDQNLSRANIGQVSMVCCGSDVHSDDISQTSAIRLDDVVV